MEELLDVRTAPHQVLKLLSNHSIQPRPSLLNTSPSRPAP